MKSGAALCVSNVKKIQKNLTEEAKKAVDTWTEGTFGISQDMVPVDKGVLRGTGETKVITDTKKEYKVEISYGKGIKYAAKQHEVPMKHKQGTDHYLSTPFNLRTGNLLPEIEQNCKGAIK